MTKPTKPPGKAEAERERSVSERGSAPSNSLNLPHHADEDSPAREPRNQGIALAVSVGFHLLIALVMASIVYRPASDGGRSAIVSTIAESPASNELTTSVSTAIGLHNASSRSAVQGLATTAARSTPITAPTSMASAARDAQPVVLRSEFDGHETDLIGAVRTAEEAEISGELKTKTHDDLAGVAEVLAEEVRQNAMFSDVVVLWLLDRSISMQRQHELLGEELKPFFDSFDAKAETNHLVLHTAVAFGAETHEIRKPTTNGHAVAAAMRRSVDIDMSGVENICSAIAKTIFEYREHRTRYREYRLLCFVLTDESGDDMDGLDATIAICRRANCAVSVVGPSAVLGASDGLHQYTPKRSRDLFHLAVRRGPETPDRYRAFIPRWAPRYRLHDNGRVGGFDAPDAWEGGPSFRGLSSGMPAYQLARLTAETGGQYVQFDRPDDRPPYEIEQLKPYLPVAPETHDPATTRVRKAVIEMAGEVNAVAPRLVLPNSFGTYTASGPTAHRLLNSQLSEALASARTMLNRVKALRQEFDDAVDEDDVQQCLPRWRASHQLLKAQLMEMESRVDAYIAAIRSIGKLRNSSNSVVIDMTNYVNPRYDGAKAKSARDQFAAIEREHAGTPWAHLAKLEREFMTSVSAEQYHADPPTIDPTPATPAAVPPRL